MQSGAARLFPLLGVIALGFACTSDEALAPDENAALARGAPLTAPANLVVAVNDRMYIELRWDDLSSGEDGTEVHRSPTPDGTFVVINTVPADVTNLGDPGRSESTRYCYKARSFRGTGKKLTYSAFSNVACATTLGPPPPPPAAPSAPRANSINSTTIVVTWTDNSGDEDGFRVERSVDLCDNWWQLAGTTAANVTTFTDAGRVPEQAVCYRVIAFHGPSKSAPSGGAYTWPPAGPTNLTAVVREYPGVDLAWTNNSRVHDYHQLLRATAEAGPYTQVTLANWYDDHGPTVYRDEYLEPNTTYWYRVITWKNGSASDPSNTAVVTTGALPPPMLPPPPSGVRAVPSGSTGARVTWTDESPNELGFRIEMSPDGGLSWPRHVNVGFGTQTSLFGGLPSEQQLCFRVRAYNDVGESAPSNVDCTWLPAAPTNATVTEEGLFTWDDNSAIEESYELWYCYIFGCFSKGWLPPDMESFLDYDYYPEFTYFLVAVLDGGYSDAAGVERLGAGLSAGASASGARRATGVTAAPREASDSMLRTLRRALEARHRETNPPPSRSQR